MNVDKDTLDNEGGVGKVWKTSITKAELAELPAAIYDGKITVVDTPENALTATRTLREAGVIGFDTETRPSFRRGEHHSVSLLQLSTTSDTFLFRLNHIGLPDCLRELLEDEGVTKIGVSIHDDFLNLRKRFPLQPRGFIDLQAYVKDFHIADNSLSRIYGILFDRRISKGQRLSNWEAPVLTSHQQEYAALDALACLHIYYHLRDKGFDFKQSKYYREFDDPTVQQQSHQSAQPEKNT